jgi:hypothetical protein
MCTTKELFREACHPRLRPRLELDTCRLDVRCVICSVINSMLDYRGFLVILTVAQWGKTSSAFMEPEG